jgi:hypothetical protein
MSQLTKRGFKRRREAGVVLEDPSPLRDGAGSWGKERDAIASGVPIPFPLLCFSRFRALRASNVSSDSVSLIV